MQLELKVSGFVKLTFFRISSVVTATFNNSSSPTFQITLIQRTQFHGCKQILHLLGSRRSRCKWAQHPLRPLWTSCLVLFSSPADLYVLKPKPKCSLLTYTNLVLFY